MDILIITFLVLSAALFFWSMRAPTISVVTVPTTQLPERRVINPRHASPKAKVWVLRACPECTLTKSLLDGRRYKTEEAQPLPLIGCRQHDCRCRYEPVMEARRGERREGQERRDEVRFETKRDRRYSNDRRHTNNDWTHNTLMR